MAQSDSSVVDQLVRNIGRLLIGNVIALALSFFTTAYLARVLGQSGFGKFSYGQTFGMYGALIVDLGLTAYGNRSVAKDPGQAGKHLWSIESVQISFGLLLISIFAAVIYTFTFWPNSDLNEIVFASILWILPFTLNIEWFFLGTQRMGVVSSSKVIQYGSILLITYLFVKSPENVLQAPLARVGGGMLSAAWLFLRLPRTVLSLFHINFREGVRYIQTSKWFWLSAILVQTYNGLDVLILQLFRPISEVGLYSASFRLMGFLVLTISLVNTAMFPMLAAESTKGKFAFRKLLNFYWLIAGCIAFILLIIGLPSVPLLIRVVYGDHYLSAIPILRILMIAASVLTINGAIAQPLLAVGYESTVTKQIVVTAALYLILNSLLIPKFGAFGAAWVYVISMVFGTVWLIPIYLKRIRKGI